MPDHPLLLLPQPEVAERTKLPSSPMRIHRPTHSRQGQRLSPIFTRLQTEFAARRADLHNTAAGADPEQVLVIETIGNVEDFANAVRRVEGLEWMGEIETDEIAPDEDFYDEQNGDRPLSGRLYLVMTNQRALDELVSLWERYRAAPDMQFERGLTKFREIFQTVKDIRRWGIQDRLLETGVLEAWQEDLAHDGDDPIRFEVELWHRSTEQRRDSSLAQVRGLIEGLEGEIAQIALIEDISYHALLAQLPRASIEQILGHPEVELCKCDSVMFFRPVGQMTTGKRPIERDRDLAEHSPAVHPLPVGEPTVAILDGLPLGNHSLLEDRLLIDDADDCASEYTVVDRMHGTAMASLVVHGDLSEGQRPLTRPVYVRPIMKPIPWIQSPRPEQIPGDVIVVDYIYRAVRRMFEGEGATDAAAPTVRIINFSIGDPSRQFMHTISPLARLLDWLSVKYSVVIVISAGNHSGEIVLEMSQDAWDALSDHEKEATVIRAIYREARNRRLMSPAESINGLAVGALHRDSATIAHMGSSVNLFGVGMPSPVSAFGSGYRRAIKPDLLFDGGRVLHSMLIGHRESARFEVRNLRIAPGQRVATPSSAPGDLNKVAYCCGTSNASALVTRQLAQCYEALSEVIEAQGRDLDVHANIAPLLKAMIIHGCSWGDLGTRLQEVLRTPENRRHIRSWIARWIGYGVPDCARVMECTAQRATVIGYGELNDGEAHLYRVPLPPSLGSRREWRRVTATCAWLSPIACGTQRYRMASMWFEMGDGAIASDRQEAEWRAVRRGTVQHEVFEGEQAVPINDGDSIEIKVNCRKDASRLSTPVPYGLFLTIEVAEGVDISIYDEIRSRVATAVQIRAREGG